MSVSNSAIHQPMGNGSILGTVVLVSVTLAAAVALALAAMAPAKSTPQSAPQIHVIAPAADRPGDDGTLPATKVGVGSLSAVRDRPGDDGTLPATQAAAGSVTITSDRPGDRPYFSSSNGGHTINRRAQ